METIMNAINKTLKRTRMGEGIVLQHARIGVSMFLLCSVWVGCGRREPIELAPEPLARVGNAVITEADFEYELQRRMATGRPLGDAQTVLGELIELIHVNISEKLAGQITDWQPFAF